MALTSPGSTTESLAVEPGKDWIVSLQAQHGSEILRKQLSQTYQWLFKSLFQDPKEANIGEIEETLMGIDMPRLTDEQKAQLAEPLTPEEIKEAAFQLHPLKAPGIDGHIPILHPDEWWLFIEIVKKQGKDWYGGAAMARKTDGEVIVMARSLQADDIVSARLLLARLVLYRLQRQGITKIWCSDKCKKWRAVFEGRIGTHWTKRTLQEDITSIIRSLQAFGFFTGTHPLSKETKKAATCAASYRVAYHYP
ncbi:hypothetical protein COLO4_36888 [Corchorus olitorius]|uniref:Uncharacterized protein n=1 Tax=Corchorus olitorius TaxID=93759 RepID=A0A1R3G4N3_9ROSI|nr:hypothetical protein COLO4_36888 [Corchorus olitorius]